MTHKKLINFNAYHVVIVLLYVSILIFRMTPENFTHILNLIKPVITKEDTVLRPSIDPELRLAITLHYLAEGTSFSAIAMHYSIGISTVSGIVKEVCHAICSVMQPLYLPVPTTHDQWKTIADGFNDIWNFPNCVGAVDGKHIIVRCPPNSGSENFNYKRFFSIVLMAVTDSRYRFLLVDIGQKGSVADGGVFEHSLFGRAILDGWYFKSSINEFW